MIAALRMSASSMSNRGLVLSLYRRILRLSQTWESKEPSNTASDRVYIRQETRTLFKQNKKLTDPNIIAGCIQEAEARVDIALHYKNPYPRPVNMPPQAMAKRKGREQGSTQEKLKKTARPIYVKSIDSPS